MYKYSDLDFDFLEITSLLRSLNCNRQSQQDRACRIKLRLADVTDCDTRLILCSLLSLNILGDTFNQSRLETLPLMLFTTYILPGRLLYVDGAKDSTVDFALGDGATSDCYRQHQRHYSLSGFAYSQSMKTRGEGLCHQLLQHMCYI